MRRYLCLFLSLLTLSAVMPEVVRLASPRSAPSVSVSITPAAQAADLPVTEGDRVILLGDSITAANKWAHYVSHALIMRNPDKLLHVQTEGRGGSTPSETLTLPGNTEDEQRYDRRVFAYEPQWVFTMFGHNGGISAAAWKADMVDLIDNYIIAKSSATPVLLGPHPTSESDGKASLGGYEDKLQELNVSFGYRWANNWHHLWPIYTNPPYWTQLQYPGTQSSPAVHPGTAGHILIGKSVYTQLGWDTAINASTINAGTLSVTSTSHCAVTRINGSAGVDSNAFSGIDFKRLPSRMGWTVDNSNAADGLDEALVMDSTLLGFETEMLTVTGLSDGTYTLYVSNDAGTPVSVGTFTDDQFTAGVNLAVLLTGPEYDQKQEVLGRIRDLHWVDRTTLAARASPAQGVAAYQSSADNQYKNLDKRGQDLIDALEDSLHYISLNITTVSTSDTFTKTSHGFSNGRRLRVSTTGVLPTSSPQLALNTDYYVVQKSASAFKLSPTPGTGGTPVDITNIGSGTFSVIYTDSIDHYDNLIHEAAQPVNRTYSIAKITGASPVVTITSPASPPSVTVGTSITFVATATDAEDGNIAANIVWTSDIDGSLGTGASITPTLTAGLHSITAAVTDAASNVSTDTINATVSTSDAGTARINRQRKASFAP